MVLEVYALLVGCRELWKLGGYKEIIEGDSFSAIQWASRKPPFQWRCNIEASFNHIPRVANAMADGLARDEVLRLNIPFNV